MATQTTVLFVDDIDGSTEGVERYTFSWLGTDYEIDLAPKSAKKLVDVMNAYTEKATRLSKAKPGSGERGVRGSAKTRTPPQELATIRSWAREQGMEVSGRGRVSEAVKDAYNEAH